METDLSKAVADAAKARGENFSAYTEQDGGNWYLIAGNRSSWYGATRVADTPYYGARQRDKARKALLFLAGAMDGFTIADDSRGLCVEIADSDGEIVTVWRREAFAAFPEFFERHGLRGDR